MSLMQQAYDTYGYAEKDFCGVYVAGANEPLAPICHTITAASIEITINQNGKFIQASEVPENDKKTIFPVTEQSAGRTSTAAANNPHPLCEQLRYFDAQNTEFYSSFEKQLAEWEASVYTHPILTAVLKYVQGKTIIADLQSANLLKKDKQYGNIKNDKDFVRWIVIGLGEEGACWKNRSLQKIYINWYKLRQTNEVDWCMISGKKTVPAKQHAKGVVTLKGKCNAKLISANDSYGFTYRGRFVDAGEAMCIGYETSQKVHNALRWVVANQGTCIDGRCFICWNPQGKQLPRPIGIMAQGNGLPDNVYTPTAYKEQLRNKLNSLKNNFPTDAKAVTAVFDAATPGRLSLNYYSELQTRDFIDRLGFWEETCCWHYRDFGVQSPSLDKIMKFAFGTVISGHLEVDEKISKQVTLQLVACRIEKSKFPISVERAIVQTAENMQIFPDDKEHEFLRSDLLFTTCAVVRKYRYDRFKEEWNMALEQDKKDRSYQFGRLMAIMEKIERDTYDSDDKRETNIIRRQQAFVTKPYSVSVSVLSHLKTAYYPQLPVSTRRFYEKLIYEIMDILSERQVDLNKPLADIYLLGYYLQKKELYTNKKEKEEENL